MHLVPLLLIAVLLAVASPAAAQINIGRAFRTERLDENHTRLTGAVEITVGASIEFRAEQVDHFLDKHLLTASGNVVFTSGTSRIAADSADYNTQTDTGVFRNASGSVSLPETVEKSMFGTQEPDAYFYGETVEKVGPEKYRITKGGFTTCLQPTPRWELVSSSATIVLDKHAILRNAVLEVKGVPVFYLPVIYYPIEKDDRATGFLIPTYGQSTYRGQSLSNAFFWAISRSQDLTLMHDWFTKTGLGMGSEYRYVVGPGSEGQARVYYLNEKESTYTTGGFESTVPARRSYDIRASVIQALPAGLRARGRIDYFSNVTVQQTYYQNIYDASQVTRSITGSLGGSFKGLSYSGAYARTATFLSSNFYSVSGATPSFSVNQGLRAIGRTPIYVAGAMNYTRLVRQDYRNEKLVYDSGLTRWDGGPQVRVPFTKWPFLTVNSSAALRLTYWDESLENGRQAPVGVGRHYWSLRSEVVGPVLTRVWNTPNMGYAEKFKHIIEPSVAFERTTAIETRNRIVQNDGSDYVFGGFTRITYGVRNVIKAKVRSGPVAARSRDIVVVGLQQSYYSDELASPFDSTYGSSYLLRPPDKFSNILLSASFAPTQTVNGGLRIEYNPTEGELQAIGASGSAAGRFFEASGGWSKQKFVLGDPRLSLGHYVNAQGTVHSPTNTVRGTYSFTLDLSNRTVLQQRLGGHYHAQCCGFSIDYQVWNYPTFDPRFPIPKDRRISISVTLAGIGSFSNPFGSFGSRVGGSR